MQANKEIPFFNIISLASKEILFFNIIFFTSIQAKLSNDTEIARAKRDFELKKATYDIEVRVQKSETFKLNIVTGECCEYCR